MFFSISARLSALKDYQGLLLLLCFKFYHSSRLLRKLFLYVFLNYFTIS